MRSQFLSRPWSVLRTAQPSHLPSCSCLLWFPNSEGEEPRPVPLVELDERLDVVQPDALDPRGNAPEHEHEELRDEEQGEPADRRSDVVVEDEVADDQRVESAR